MDRNREARRANMPASTNGLSRRRHRSNTLRDSPDEDGSVDFSESVRLRERVKKDRNRERERDRERERERSSRSKRRRGGDDSSQESNHDDDDDDDDDNNNHHHHSNGGGGVRLLPPNPSAAASFPNHHHHSSSGNNNNNNNHHLHLQHRKTFPPGGSSANVLRGVAAPVWKSGDEMIGVSVPRKARSAHTKRSHDWISSTSGGGEQNHRQASTSPARQSVVSTSTASPAPPLSPSSSNASGRKKIKANGSSNKQRPPKTSSKSTSSNPEELEFEIAEVLFGLMNQSQAPSKKDIASNDSREANNRSSGDAKSRVSSPVSNSPSPAILPTNSNSSAAPFSAVAPKRKRPRLISENQSSCSATAKAEIDQTLTMKAEVSSNLEKTAVENGVSVSFEGLTSPSDPVPEPVKVDSETKPAVDELRFVENRQVAGKEEMSSPKKESAVEDSNREDSTAMAPATATKPIIAVTEVENHRQEKIQIDLMAPPPQLRSSPDGQAEVNFSSTVANHKTIASGSIYEMKLGKVEAEEKKAETESKKSVEGGKGRDIDLQLDLEKLERDGGIVNNKSQQPSQKQYQQQPQPQPLVKMNKEEHNTEKASQSSSLPLPMSMGGWSGGLPPMGYMPPLQGVVAMDGSTIPPTPMQPIFSQPRPKRCATHCYIARNIHLLQQFVKMNPPIWLPTASSASLFGSKACNLNVVPATEFNGNIAGRGVNTGPDKGQGLAIFPGLGGKDKGSSQAPNIADPAQRKQQQQILLQQPLPAVAPNNLMPGHTFIFPLNQQQAATAAPRPAATGPLTSPNASNSASGNVATVTAGGNPAGVSFSYPNMPPNETPYLAILQNNAYFPIPTVGAPLNYRGTHAQPLPLLNGSFYSPPHMIHPSQLQQHQQQQQPTNSQSKQMQQQNTSMSSGSSSSHKHLQNQQQKRPQGNAVTSSSGNGNLQNFPASKSHPSQPQHHPQNQHIVPPQARHIENEMGSEDSPSTAESQGSRPPMNIYNHQNYMMQIHPSNFGMMAPPATMGVVSAAATNSSGNQSEKKPQPPQQQSLKTGLESMPPQPFAMSFTSISGASTPGIDISSMAQSHAIFQSLPEATRQNLHIVAAAAVAQAAVQQKKNYREESRSGSGDPTTTADDERKGGLAGKVPATSAGVGQSITFSRPDLPDISGSKMAANNAIDSSRSTSLASGPPAWTARAVVPNSMGTVVSNAQLHAQFQQQMVQQLHKQQQQHQQHQQQLATAAARSKAPPTSNGIVYPEHLTSSASPVGAKLSNTISAFPQNLVQTSSNNSPTHSQSLLWKSSAKASPSQAQSSLASATSSLKNTNNHHQQQQQLRTQQNHTQISFGANQKSTPSSNQSQSTAMMAGSPTTSSISKGASGSPRTAAATCASMSNKTDQNTPSQQPGGPGKSSMPISNQKSSSPASGRSVPSILGNQHVPSTSSSGGGSKTQMLQQQQQPQQHQQLLKGAHQSQLFFSSSYGQAQPTGSSSPSATSGYYIQQRRRPEQQQQAQQPPSSTGMLTLCPVTLGSGGGGGTTSDPAKAIAAASSSNNMRGGNFPSQSIQFPAQSSVGNQHHILPAGFPYVHHVPTAVQVKPTEQKQPAA